jgi:hypothetical protein
MKTIKQQEQISFHAITIKDALTLVPLMDELVHMANHNSRVELYQSLPQEQQNEYQRVWKKDTISIPAKSVSNILQVLTDLGFESVLNRHEATLDDLEKK